MTLPATTRRAGPFNGNGSTTSFPFTFKVFSASDITVIKTSSGGVESTLALNSDYTVTLNADQDATPGGTITYPVSGTALASTEKLSAVGALAYDQTLDLPSGGNFSPIALENALDRIEMQVQQVNESTSRAVTLPVSSSSGVSTSLPTPSGNKVLGWNSSGTALQNVDVSSLASVVAYGTANSDLFSGTGSQTVFTLSANPASINNLDVSIGGVSQRPGIDYLWTTGTTVTFITAPPSGTSNILIRYMQALAFGSAAASDVSYTPGGTGAVASTVQTKLRESVSVKDFGAKGDGVTDDTAAVQAAIDYLANGTGGTLIFPPGTYLHASTLVFKNKINYRGFNQSGATTLKYTGSSDQVQVNNPINSSTAAYILVQDIVFQATVRTTKKANFADIGSTYIEWNRCSFIGNEYGLILDQSELAVVQECVFASHTQGSIWLVNGADHTSGGLSFFTNRITIRNNQFNESSTCDMIVNDGGTVHVIENNNFNAGAIQIRVCAPRNLRITGNEMEGCSVQCIRFGNTTKYGSTLGTGVGVEVANNFLVGASSTASPHNALIDFNTGCTSDITMYSNSFLLDTGGAIPTSDPTTTVSFISAWNNLNKGTMTSNVPFNNFNQDTTWAPTVGGNTTLGTGTYTTRLGRYTQNGNIHSFEAQIVWTAHTGTGTQLLVSLPKGVVANGPQFIPVTVVSSGITLGANAQMVALINNASSPFGTAGVIQLYTSALGVVSALAMQTSGTLYISGSFVSK